MNSMVGLGIELWTVNVDRGLAGAVTSKTVTLQGIYYSDSSCSTLLE